MKKILVSLLTLGLIRLLWLNICSNPEISEDKDIFFQVPISEFSRYPTKDSFIGFGLLNKSDIEKKIIEIEFYREDGTTIMKKELKDVIKGSNLKLSDVMC
ncbi:hypothetical protein GX420_01135 [bacterium]|nr:hypothetical protein [bacterium]